MIHNLEIAALFILGIWFAWSFPLIWSALRKTFSNKKQNKQVMQDIEPILRMAMQPSQTNETMDTNLKRIHEWLVIIRDGINRLEIDSKAVVESTRAVATEIKISRDFGQKILKDVGIEGVHLHDHVHTANEQPSPDQFVYTLEYARDKFATSTTQKRVLSTIISHVKKSYGDNKS